MNQRDKRSSMAVHIIFGCFMISNFTGIQINGNEVVNHVYNHLDPRLLSQIRVLTIGVSGLIEDHSSLFLSQ